MNHKKEALNSCGGISGTRKEQTGKKSLSKSIEINKYAKTSSVFKDVNGMGKNIRIKHRRTQKTSTHKAAFK